MSVGLARTGQRPPPTLATARAIGEVGRLAERALLLTQVTYLAVLWVVACLPIVTIPAASVALIARIRAWRTSGREPSAREMVREIRTAFARRTATMLLVASAVVVLALDLRAIGIAPEAVRPAALMMWFAMSIAVAMLTAFVPAVLATRDITGIAALRCSARAAVRRPALALTAVAALVVAAVVVISSPVTAPLLAVATAWVLDTLSAGTDISSLTDERNDAA